jgi:hypothetical protein
MNRRVIALLATIALTLASPPSTAAQSASPVEWIEAVKVAAAAGEVTKTAGCNECPDAGAVSAAQLTGDGFIEFTALPGHRILAGLGSDLSASTSLATDFAFSFWPNGTWEIRESGTYRKDGAFAPGDRFRIVVQAGTVKYLRNGVTVYSSTAVPSFPLVLDTVIFTVGGGLTGSVLGPLDAGATEASTTPMPEPDTAPTPAPAPSPGTVDTSGYYRAVIDRDARPEPAIPALGGAGSEIIDPTFQTRIIRVTDGSTRPSRLNRSYRTPSSSHQHAWSANGTYFYAVSTDGTIVPFRFDGATGTASRINPSATGEGGLIVRSYLEPQFSYVSDNLIYVNGVGSTVRTIGQYDFAADKYTLLMDVDTIVPGLDGTYLGWIGSSAGIVERIVTFFGGTSQDQHYYAMVFDKNDPSKRRIVNTRDSLIDGVPTNITLNFKIHAVSMDRSGRYVMLYSTSADIGGTRKAAPTYLWDLATNLFTELPLVSARSGGHDSFGYGVRVNQDCCTSTSWDAAQWQFRWLDSPMSTRDLVKSVLQPKEVYLADHSTWHNARPDVLMPVISALYRDDNAAPWRAWDSEIVAIQTDAPTANATVWRFAHHRSNILSDAYPTLQAFWYTPRPNVSDDGRWVLFTSNWEKTLGMDAGGDIYQGHRQDLFLVRLEANATVPHVEPAPEPEPEPEVAPLAITTSALKDGVRQQVYSSILAADAQAGVTWTVTAGTLPAGLSLNGATGVISGTCQKQGSWTFTVSATDSRTTASRQLSMRVRVK